MANSSESRQKVLLETRDAIRELMRDIEKRLALLPEGDRLVLIALARKMPRLLKRIFREYPIEERRVYQALLSRCLLTTEHAIPFIFKDAGSETSVLVLDDIIITGTTLKKVLSDLNLLTDSDADVWTLYCYEEALAPEFSNDIEVGSGQFLNMQECKEKLNTISSIIAEKELPIDLEFPILHYPDSERETPTQLERLWTDEFANYSQYTLPSGDTKTANKLYLPLKSQNILFYSMLGEERKYSFGKIRIFFDNEDIRIASFCPTVVAQEDLLNMNLFTEPYYCKIWEYVNEAIDWRDTPQSEDSLHSPGQYHDYNLTIARTLTITANWLYSLSLFVDAFSRMTFPNNKSVYVGFENLLPEIHIENLKWLFGDKLAAVVAEYANKILANHTIVTSYNYPVTIPLVMYDKSSREAFIDNIIKSTMAAENINDALNRIFGIINSIRTHTLREIGIVEENKTNPMSLRGLRYYLQFSFGQDKIDILIHKWLDEAIDRGLIIPKYMEVIDDNFNLFWGRYYLPSHFAESPKE